MTVRNAPTTRCTLPPLSEASTPHLMHWRRVSIPTCHGLSVQQGLSESTGRRTGENCAPLADNSGFHPIFARWMGKTGLWRQPKQLWILQLRHSTGRPLPPRGPPDEPVLLHLTIQDKFVPCADVFRPRLFHHGQLVEFWQTHWVARRD